MWYAIIMLVLPALQATESSNQCYSTKYLSPIPRDHLFHTKKKPLVLGHRGNARTYQENTLDGFTSLLGTNADGFEMDIYLTKDEQLVVFHDDNTKVLTGEDHIVWDTDAATLTSLRVSTTINYKGNKFTFSKPRPIPLLKDVLEAVKGHEKILVLEVKPNTARNIPWSTKAGRALAKMVTDMALVNQVLITSFDPFVSLAAKQYNPKLSVGLFYIGFYWLAQPHASFRSFSRGSVDKLPGMAECVRNSPTGTAFFAKMFESGAVLKAINASFMDMDYKIYDNPKYSNDTIQTLHRHYSPSFSAGAWALYNMALTKEEDAGQDAVVEKLVKMGVERLITDDVNRLLKKIGRTSGTSGDSLVVKGVAIVSMSVLNSMMLLY